MPCESHNVNLPFAVVRKTRIVITPVDVLVSIRVPRLMRVTENQDHRGQSPAFLFLFQGSFQDVLQGMGQFIDPGIQGGEVVFGEGNRFCSGHSCSIVHPLLVTRLPNLFCICYHNQNKKEAYCRCGQDECSDLTPEMCNGGV